MVVRNWFYNYNHYDESSSLNQCGAFDKSKDKRMHNYVSNKEEFSIHYFFQDSNNNWFFRTTMCKHYKGFVYGYEIRLI